MAALAIQILTLPKLPPMAAPGLNSFKAALSRRSVAGFGTAFLVVSGHFAGFTFIRPFLEEVTRLDISTVSLALLVFGLGGFLGNFAGGVIAEHNPAWAVAFSAFLIASAAFALSLFGTFAGVAFTATALWGFAFGGFPVAISIWNARAAPDHAESAGALLSSIFQVAIAIGAALGGLIIDRLGSNGVILYAASTALVGAVVMLFLSHANHRKIREG